MPLSKDPSPNCELETSVNVAKKPNPRNAANNPNPRNGTNKF